MENISWNTLVERIPMRMMKMENISWRSLVERIPMRMVRMRMAMAMRKIIFHEA